CRMHHTIWGSLRHFTSGKPNPAPAGRSVTSATTSCHHKHLPGAPRGCLPTFASHAHTPRGGGCARRGGSSTSTAPTGSPCWPELAFGDPLVVGHGHPAGCQINHVHRFLR